MQLQHHISSCRVVCCNIKPRSQLRAATISRGTAMHYNVFMYTVAPHFLSYNCKMQRCISCVTAVKCNAAFPVLQLCIVTRRGTQCCAGPLPSLTPLSSSTVPTLWDWTPAVSSHVILPHALVKQSNIHFCLMP